jgi:hypothetical protein
MVRKSTALYLGFTVFILTAWATPAITQGPVQESALLTEVRLLRQAIEALASNGSRIELVFGRLQLQEQRTNTALRRLSEARSALASHMVSMSAVSNRLAELESTSSSTSHTSEELKAIQEAMAHYKREVARLEAERVRLATDEADAAQALGVEQGRWSDINRQVEELERVLLQRR